LIPPKVGAIFLIVFIISSVSCVSRIIGKAFTQAKALNKAHFHSITGNPAIPQIFPSHKTALPSEITATIFPFIVYS